MAERRYTTPTRHPVLSPNHLELDRYLHRPEVPSKGCTPPTLSQTLHMSMKGDVILQDEELTLGQTQTWGLDLTLTQALGQVPRS